MSKKFTMRIHFKATSAVWSVVFLLSGYELAYAYTDPGTGLLLWQMLVAFFVGAGFYYRKGIERLWNVFAKNRKDEKKK